MWQVFEGNADTEYANTIGLLRHAGYYDGEAPAVAAAEDLYWGHAGDWRWYYFVVAVDFDARKIVIFGGMNPFSGDWDEDFRPEPEFFKPERPLRSPFTLADLTAPTRLFSQALATGSVGRNTLLERMKVAK